MKALLITPCEFIYQPRLLKTAKILSENGYEITILYSNISNVNSSTVKNMSKKYNVLKTSILKNKSGWKNYIIATILQKLFAIFFKNSKNTYVNSITLNKYSFGLQIPNSKFDLVYTNLIESLYLAVKCKEKYSSKLIFDSQEYFKGQFSSDKTKLKLIAKLEKQILGNVDVLFTTTQCMANYYANEFNNLSSIIMVRNVPFKCDYKKKDISSWDGVTKLIWNGITINAKSERGIHIILEGMQYIEGNVKLFLSGNISVSQKNKIFELIDEFKVREKVILIPAFEPNLIIENLSKFDIGLIGEINTDLNQNLTSSNKLFNYIAAGLRVVASDVAGVKETFDEFDIGYIYKNGDPVDFAIAVNKMITDGYPYQNNIDPSNLCWENDFSVVLKKLKHEKAIDSTY